MPYRRVLAQYLDSGFFTRGLGHADCALGLVVSLDYIFFGTKNANFSLHFYRQKINCVQINGLIGIQIKKCQYLGIGQNR